MVNVSNVWGTCADPNKALDWFPEVVGDSSIAMPLANPVPNVAVNTCLSCRFTTALKLGYA